MPRHCSCVFPVHLRSIFEYLRSIYRRAFTAYLYGILAVSLRYLCDIFTVFLRRIFRRIRSHTQRQMAAAALHDSDSGPLHGAYFRLLAGRTAPVPQHPGRSHDIFHRPLLFALPR